jgi:hypothetical protein
MGGDLSSRFQQLLDVNLPKTEPIVFDAAIAGKLCDRIDGIRLHVHTYSLLHNLTHGSLKPASVLEFAYQHKLRSLNIHVDDESLLIQHGRFYSQDFYPDPELFAMAGMLVRKFYPDYLLVHPMGMDDIGHKYSADSSEYRRNAIHQDVALANLFPEWMERGYNIIVTGDHGMNADHGHGGTTPDMREVPLFLIRPGVPGEGDTGKMLSQLKIAPTVCKLLDVPIPESMKQTPIIW